MRWEIDFSDCRRFCSDENTDGKYTARIFYDKLLSGEDSGMIVQSSE